MSDFSEKRLVIACGGTGGHLFPGIAVAESWTRQGGDVLLLISSKQIDTLAAEGYSHLKFEKMPSVAMPGLFSLKMPGFLVGFLRSLRKCRSLMRDFKADAVLGMGGFTSTAPLLAGRLAGLPTFIHESNAVPGKANRLNAKFSSAVLVGFGQCVPFFGKGKRVELVGTPLRPSVTKKPTREEGLAHFGLRTEKKTLMVMGGSQGARRINELVASALPEIMSSGVQILHISGPADYELVKPAYDRHPDAGNLLDFCGEVQFAYAAADLAVCRSGAATLTELAYYEIPSVLIPYPFAADDHQTANAEIFSLPGAAELWRQADLNEDNFAGKVIELINDGVRLERMKKNAATLAIPDASNLVCEVVSEAIN